MKKIFFSLFFLIITFSFVPVVFAAESGGGSSQTTTGLAQLAQCSGTDCSACNVVHLANGFIKWLIGFTFILFTILLFVAGVRMVTSGGNSHAVEESKGSFVNAIIGLIIILSAWLIVDTIMRSLVGTPGHEGQLISSGSATGYLFWSEVSCQTQDTPKDTGQVTLEGEGLINTINLSTVPVGSLGTGNGAILAYASAMDNKHCQYSQALRNACSGNPGYTDCSDLVNNAFVAAGCRSPGSNTGIIYGNSQSIGNQSTLQAGDAVVFRHGDTGHVVICENAGCTSVIHASGRGAPDGQAATVPVSDQLKVSDSSYYLSQPGARVARASTFCPSSSGPQ
jgi:hypothetical protein